VQIPTSVRLGSGTESSVRAMASTADVVAPDCADREGSVSNWVVIGYLGMGWRLFTHSPAPPPRKHRCKTSAPAPSGAEPCTPLYTKHGVSQFSHTESKKKLTGCRILHAPAAQLRSLRPVHAPPVRAQVAHVLPRALRRGAAKVTLEPTVVEPSGEGVHVRL